MPLGAQHLGGDAPDAGGQRQAAAALPVHGAIALDQPAAVPHVYEVVGAGAAIAVGDVGPALHLDRARVRDQVGEELIDGHRDQVQVGVGDGLAGNAVLPKHRLDPVSGAQELRRAVGERGELGADGFGGGAHAGFVSPGDDQQVARDQRVEIGDQQQAIGLQERRGVGGRGAEDAALHRRPLLAATASEGPRAAAIDGSRVPRSHGRRSPPGRHIPAAAPRPPPRPPKARPVAAAWSAVAEVDDAVAAGLLGRDHDAPLGALALALGAEVGVVGQRGVDGAALVGLHRLEPDALLVALGPVGDAQGQLSHGVLAAGPVALDVDDDGIGVVHLLADHGVDQQLQRPQGVAPPADQQPQVLAADVDDRGAFVVALEAVLDLGLDAHPLQQLDQQPLCLQRVLAQDGDPDLGGGGNQPQDGAAGLLQDLDLDPLGGHVQLRECGLEGLLNGLPGRLYRRHPRSPRFIWHASLGEPSALVVDLLVAYRLAARPGGAAGRCTSAAHRYLGRRGS